MHNLTDLVKEDRHFFIDKKLGKKCTIPKWDQGNKCTFWEKIYPWDVGQPINGFLYAFLFGFESFMLSDMFWIFLSKIQQFSVTIFRQNWVFTILSQNQRIFYAFSFQFEFFTISGHVLNFVAQNSIIFCSSFPSKLKL